MVVNEFGQILEASELELYKKFWEEEYDKILSFPQFLKNLQQGGTRIVKTSRSLEEVTKENGEMYKLLIAISNAYKTCNMENITELAREVYQYMEGR